MASRGLHEESAALVRSLYEGLLRREPDEEGWARWTKAVVDGLPLSEVAKAFAMSDEFRTYWPVKLYVPPGHFYSPIVNPSDAERALAAVERKPIPVSVPGVTIDRAEM